jgi:hypothetical protein
MSPEERQLLGGLFDRLRGAANNPRDKEAEALIVEETKAQPYAPYLLAQTVIVQDQALRAASERLQDLEGKVRDLEQQAAQQARGAGGFLGGLGALFGGAAPQPPARPRGGVPPSGMPWRQQPPGGGLQQPGYGQPPYPQAQQGYPQAQQGGPWGGQQAGQGGGGSFLKGALGTAAGVAGGVLLADSIRGLFSGHGSGGLGNNGLGIGDGFADAGAGQSGDTFVTNYYGDDAQDQGQSFDAGQDPGIQDADYDSDYGSDFDAGDDGMQDI